MRPNEDVLYGNVDFLSEIFNSKIAYTAFLIFKFHLQAFRFQLCFLISTTRRSSPLFVNKMLISGMLSVEVSMNSSNV